MIRWFLALFRRPEAAAAPQPATTADIGVAPGGLSATEFIAGFEGFRAAAYLCPAGVPTIGFGTTRYPGGKAVTLADPPCARDQALKWLANDVAGAETAVTRLVKVSLTEGQRVSLVSLTYNIGTGAFGQSTLLALLNKGRLDDAAREFARWNKAGGKELPGLTKRRAAETALFLS